MKHFLILGLALILVSCSSPSHKTGERDISSVGPNLAGAYLGVAQYSFGHHGPNKPAVRMYLHEIEGEGGAYHAVLLEHVNMLGMAPQYLASNKLPALNKMIGYLKKIIKKITVYKVTETDRAGTYQMQTLTIKDGVIGSETDENPSLLVLSQAKNLAHPLEGALVTASVNGEPAPVRFPASFDKKKKYGLQYKLANYVYVSKGLKSTWRKEYLPGPYLASYGKKHDVVLKLSIDGGANLADFVLNPEKAKAWKRIRKLNFTNGKSAFIEGHYNVSEPADGMFVFSPDQGKQTDSEHVVDRLGLFIDIFDATEALNQDVVELALIDPQAPEDFLMYYEDPDNGEGGDSIKAPGEE
jgi:hypothetical protein